LNKLPEACFESLAETSIISSVFLEKNKIVEKE